MKYDVVIIGSGPAGLGAAYHLLNKTNKILIIEKNSVSSGGLRNDCKQNYTWPIGFPLNIWNQEEAKKMLEMVKIYLEPEFLPRKNIATYQYRSDKLDVHLVDIQQYHVGTDNAIILIKKLINNLINMGVDVLLNTEAISIDVNNKIIITTNDQSISYDKLIIAPGRGGFKFLQKIMDQLKIPYIDNMVDIGIRLEMEKDNYPIVEDYYDPKFLFLNKVRTFCTNSHAAYVVKEKYDTFYSANGHSFSKDRESNGLVNFALLKTIHLTDPISSGSSYARILGESAMAIGGNNILMQRIGDFRLGKRSKIETFNLDIYDFKPSLNVTAGDISLAIPSKILKDIWKGMKLLDTIIPGILHPSTIMYYPEIKTYANKPKFMDNHFQVYPDIYMIGDGAGTSRGITAAWASGIMAAIGVILYDV